MSTQSLVNGQQLVAGQSHLHKILHVPTCQKAINVVQTVSFPRWCTQTKDQQLAQLARGGCGSSRLSKAG